MTNLNTSLPKDHKFVEPSKSIFREKSPSHFLTRPMSPIYNFQTKKIQQTKINDHFSTFIKKQQTNLLQPPTETITHQPISYSFQTSGLPVKKSQIVMHPVASQLRYSPPHGTTILTNSRVMPTGIVPQIIPRTTYVTHAPIIHPIPFQNITQIQTIRTETPKQDNTEIEKLKSMNEFLSENYTLVYNKLKQLQNEKAGFKFETESINQAMFLKTTIQRVEQIYEFQLEAALARIRTYIPQRQIYTKSIRTNI